MKWAFLVAGLILGFVSGAGGILYLQGRNKDASEMSIVFAPKNYYESPAAVMVSGTLTGDGQAYPNNTYSMACFQDRKECWMTSVQAIGNQQIGRMDAPYYYAIRKWTSGEVIAGDDGAFGCFKTTITIERTSQEVLWVEEPVNQTQVTCKNAENRIRKYTIESSPGWKKVFGKKS